MQQKCQVEVLPTRAAVPGDYVARWLVRSDGAVYCRTVMRHHGLVYSETALPKGAAVWRSAGSERSVVSADGCVDVILRDGRAFVAGPSTRWIATERDGESGSLGFRLPPGHARFVLRFELAAIADQVVPLVDLLHRRAAGRVREAVERWGDGSDSTERLAMVAHQAWSENRWAVVVRRRAVAGVPAKRVAIELACSDRTFQRRMLSTFGYGYATLVRIERARYAQALLHRGEGLAVTAIRAGFSDQSHLTREFRRLVGVSPGQFAARSA